MDDLATFEELFCGQPSHLLSLLSQSPEWPSRAVSHLLLAKEVFQDFLASAVLKEIQTTNDPILLFRQESVATSLFAIIWDLPVAAGYLRFLVAPILAQLPSINETENGEPIELVKRLVESFLERTVGSCNECPPIIKWLCTRISKTVESKFSGSTRNAVASALFLRFICPALIFPENYHLITECPPKVRKVFVLIGKAVQHLVNGTDFSEPHNAPINFILQVYRKSYSRFIESITQHIDAPNFPQPWPHRRAKRKDLNILFQFLSTPSESLDPSIQTWVSECQLTLSRVKNISKERRASFRKLSKRKSGQTLSPLEKKLSKKNPSRRTSSRSASAEETLRITLTKQRSQETLSASSVEEWNPAEVTHWLGLMGLSKYAKIFKQQAITGADLLELDQPDFESLGLDQASSGVLLRALDELKARNSASSISEEEESPSQLRLIAIPLSSWTNPQVVDWMNRNGFKHVASAIRENQICGEDLVELDEEELAEMGFSSSDSQRLSYEVDLLIAFQNSLSL